VPLGVPSGKKPPITVPSKTSHKTGYEHRKTTRVPPVGLLIKIQFVWTPEDLQEAMPAFEQAAQKYG
jgi:hypothetical protein